MEKKKIQISVPADLSHSSLVRHIADEVFGVAKFEKAWCSRLKLVVDELFMNAVRYGSTEGTSTIYITFSYDGAEIQFTIEDDGTGSHAIPAEELKKIIQQNEENSDLTRTSGRGLSMITKLWTDQMTIDQSQYGGIAVTFIKRLDTAQAPPPSPPPPTGLVEQAVAKTAPASPTAPQAAPDEATAGQSAPAPAPAQPAPEGPVQEIKLSGEIDQSNINEKVAPISDQIEVMPQNGVLVLDFSELAYINSTFIGHLAAWHNAMQKKGGHIRLKSVNKEIMEVLDLVGLLSVLNTDAQ